MLAKIELPLADLTYLYNLLIYVQTFVDKGEVKPEMSRLMEETNEALEQLSGETIWFVCLTEGCNPTPFRLTASELADAEGVVCCDTCGRLCYRAHQKGT